MREIQYGNAQIQLSPKPNLIFTPFLYFSIFVLISIKINYLIGSNTWNCLEYRYVVCISRDVLDIMWLILFMNSRVCCLFAGFMDAFSICQSALNHERVRWNYNNDDRLMAVSLPDTAAMPPVV